MSNTKDTPMDYKQFEGYTPVKVKTIHTDEHGLVVSMDDYDILERDYDSLKFELQKQKEEIEQLRDVIEKLLLSAGYALHESIIEEAKKLIYK